MEVKLTHELISRGLHEQQMTEATPQISWNQCKIKNHPLKLTNKHYVFNVAQGAEAPFHKRNYNNFMTSVAGGTAGRGSPG